MIIYFIFLTIIFELMILDKLISLKKSQANYFYNDFSTNVLPYYSVNPGKKFSYLIILAIIFIFSFSAFRFNVGWDYIEYYNTVKFDSITNIVSNGEYATIFLVEIARSTGITNLYFAINSFVCIFLISKTIKNYSVDPWLSIIFFICFPLFYLNSFSVIRFFTALSITFYGIKYIENRKFLKYLIVVVLASLFHNSASLALLFYFVGNIKFKTSRIVLILVTIPIARNIINKFVVIYFPEYSSYTQITSVQEGTKAIIFLTIVGILALILRDRITEGDSVANIYFNIYFIGLGIYLMFFTQGTMGHRLSLYGTIYSLLLIPKMVEPIKHNKEGMLLMLFLYSLFIIMFLFIVNVGSTTYIPYRTIFGNK